MKKNTTWMRFRHKVMVAVIAPFLGTYIRIKYGIRIRRFKDKRPHLIIMNHQTGFDQFFVSLALMRPVYYIASEDIFSMGFASDLIRWIAAPIPIKKQTLDIQAVKNCIKVAKEGGTICLAPEGNRTFHGKTLYMNPAIAGLTKKLGLPLAVFRISGGYGVHPRWSDVVRKGRMEAGVVEVIEPEEYKDMTNQALFERIENALYVDEACVTGHFRHKKNAEFLERVFYVCPKCGLTEFESHKDIIRCKTCDMQIRHLDTKELVGVNEPFPHSFVAGWYDWQNDYVNQLELSALTDAPVYEETVQLSRVHACKRKELLSKSARIRLYGDRITVDDREFPFATIGAVVILGKNKLNIYDGSEIFQIKGCKRFNGLKYLNFYHRFKNIASGDESKTFLGI